MLVAGELLGTRAKTHVDYFDVCRRKRSKVDYDLAAIVTGGEVEELIGQVTSFRKLCESSVSPRE